MSSGVEISHEAGSGFGANRQQRGTTLLEALLAMTVFFVSMIILYACLLTSQVQSHTNKDNHRALQDTRALMEQMATIPITNLGDVFPHNTWIPEFDDLHVRNQKVKVLYQNGNADAVPLHYEVMSTWTTAEGRPAKLSLKGVRAR
jgi:hypothetical protein